MDTFVVRLWSPAPPDDAPAAESELRGTAQHVATGRSAPFRTGPQLLDLLAELRAASDDGPTTTTSTTTTTHETKRDTSKEQSA